MVDLPFEMQISKGTIEFWRDTIRIRVTHPVDVAENILPSAFALEQNYPNPFNPYNIHHLSAPIVQSRHTHRVRPPRAEVATLVDENKPAGVHTVQFDAWGLASGVYLYRMQAGSYTSTRKMAIVK